MYEELVKELRKSTDWATADGGIPVGLIYRLSQAADAIEQSQKDLERSKEYEAFWEKEANEALRKFQVAIASKPRWMPVTERLPEIDDDVLLYAEWTGVSGTVYKDIILSSISECESMKYRVTHWMPLPEPPKEEPQIISAVDCKDCRYYPPSSLNGKPCTQCDMGNSLMNCFSPKEENDGT